VADPWCSTDLSASLFRLRTKDRRFRACSNGYHPACLVRRSSDVVCFLGPLFLRHDWLGTALHVGLLAASIGGMDVLIVSPVRLFARARKLFVWAQAWKDGRTTSNRWSFGSMLFRSIFYLRPPLRLSKAFHVVIDLSLVAAARRSLEHIGFKPFVILADRTFLPTIYWTGDVKDIPW